VGARGNLQLVAATTETNSNATPAANARRKRARGLGGSVLHGATCVAAGLLCGTRIEPKDKGFYWPGDVLQCQLADRPERQIEPAVHMVAHRARDADAADRARRLQPGRDVHAVAVQVRAVRDHIADVDADAEANAPVRRLVAVIDRDLLLHLDRATHRTVDAVERDQQRVATGLHYSAAVLADCRVDQRAPQSAQAVQGASIVLTDQPAVADHVGIDDGDQLPAARGLAGEVRTDTCDTHDRDDSTTAGRRDKQGAEPGAGKRCLDGQSLSD
jgi:hypothetical protein